MKRLAPLALVAALGCASQPEPATHRTTSASSSSTRDGGLDSEATTGDADSESDEAELEAAANLPPAEVDRGCSVLPRVCARGACDAEAISNRRALRAQRGPVSYYGDQFHGRRTANGERYDKRALSAASRTLPFGAIVRIRRVDDPSQVTIVRVNDRGPFGRRGRILDLSRAAAECIGMIRAGVVEVRAEVIDWGPNGRP